MVVHAYRTENISSIARASGLPWYVVATLIDHYDVRTETVGNQRLIHPDDLDLILAILRRHPGVRESFARRI